MSLQSNQLKFIGSPISAILREAVAANTAIGNGIETYSVHDYILHSIFLKITGAQEQKMKCIVWELASHDYEYRYLRYSQKPYGECSCYDDKNKIYKDLIDQISKFDPSFDVNAYLDKTQILGSVKNELDNIFHNSSLIQIRSREYNGYQIIINSVKEDCFVVGSQSANKKGDERRLFSICDKCNHNGAKANYPHCLNSKNLFDIYGLLYKHRNRCAHNTTSYQQNLPILSTLSNSEYRYENFFLYFAILVLIDEIFIILFHKYTEVINMQII